MDKASDPSASVDKRIKCNRRESNPELGHGKTQCYRYTTNAYLGASVSQYVCSKLRLYASQTRLPPMLTLALNHHVPRQYVLASRCQHAMKRKSVLLGKQSPFHANVTLYEPSPEDTPPRRSKRLKTSDAVSPATSSYLAKSPQSSDEDGAVDAFTYPF